MDKSILFNFTKRIVTSAWMCFLTYLSAASSASAAPNGTCFHDDQYVIIEMAAGYRVDDLKMTAKGFDPSLQSILRDTAKIENMRIFEFGAKGRVAFLKNWNIRGYALFGRAREKQGRYVENTRVPFSLDPVTHTVARIEKGTTQDYSIGLGYLFPFMRFEIGPTAGWAWNTQHIKVDKAETNETFDCILSELTWKNHWRGPWIGAEVQFSCWEADLCLNYEFHMPSWHAEWFLAGPDFPPFAFSDLRHSHRGFGNVVSLDADVYFYDWILVGLNFKYLYWHIREGREKPRSGDFAAEGLPGTKKEKTTTSSWDSYSIQIDLGFFF